MKFTDAVIKSKTLSVKPNDETLLKLYGLYKQATLGDCNISSPWPWDVVGCAKWNAWSARKGKSKEDAGKLYIKLVEVLLKEDVARLLKQMN